MVQVIEEEIQRETATLEQQRRSMVMMTVGKVLLWMDLLLVCFVYVGLRSGSDLFLWWVAGEGVLGLVLLGVGSHGRITANRKLAQLKSR
jgi:pheromone shutdown protein TraB